MGSRNPAAFFAVDPRTGQVAKIFQDGKGRYEYRGEKQWDERPGPSLGTVPGVPWQQCGSLGIFTQGYFAIDPRTGGIGVVGNGEIALVLPAWGTYDPPWALGSMGTKAPL